jgi:hypothetical protein
VSDKFIGYFQIVDACEQPGCPVCRCLDDGSRRDLAAILYEQVTDPETRRRLRDAWGLCNWHTWMLLDAGSVATGAAIVYEDVLRACRRRVARLRDRRVSPFARLLGWLRAVAERVPAPALPRLVERYHERARCPVCARLVAAEAHYVATVVDGMEDPSFRRAYGRSAGLCLPHLVRAVERRGGTPGVVPLLEATLEKWEALGRDLQSFVAKNEYRNAEPITADEADSYRRTFEVVAGRRGVFGNDLRRQR